MFGLLWRSLYESALSPLKKANKAGSAGGLASSFCLKMWNLAFKIK